MAVGAALLTVGAGGVLTLLISAALGSKSLWDEWWYVVLVAVFTGLTLLGLYVLAAVYFSLPLPQTRAAREAKGELKIGDAFARIKTSEYCVVEVPLSIGRLDIDNASTNVLVPDVMTITRVARDGGAVDWQYGLTDHTSESLDGEHGSNFWQQGLIHLSAFTDQAMWFRITLPPGQGPFPLRFKLGAAVLHGETTVNTTIDPRAEPGEDV